MTALGAAAGAIAVPLRSAGCLACRIASRRFFCEDSDRSPSAPALATGTIDQAGGRRRHEGE